jgi:AcrR family transcriptional regulator
MKKELKSLLTREKLLAAAMEEFSSKGYDSASVNDICKSSGVPKGNLYHNFSSKEALYLACVKETFTELTQEMQAKLSEEAVSPEAYFRVRVSFFQAHPAEAGIFCGAVLFPPMKLQKGIEACRAEFDAFNREILQKLIGDRKLRKGLSEEMVADVFRQLQNGLNADFRNQQAGDSHEKLIAHELACQTALSVFLYGALDTGGNAAD